MKKLLIVLSLFFFISCENVFKKSEFECFNKIEVQPKYDPLLMQEKFIKEHLDDYYYQFSIFYKNAFEKLDNQANIFGLFSKVVGSVWDSKGMIRLESNHKSLYEKYNEEVLDLIAIEIQKINILIYYTYYERMNYYRSSIPTEGEPLNTNSVHPRFFVFEYADNDKLYGKFLASTLENLRVLENNLAKVRLRKAYQSLYLNSECDLSHLAEELISYVRNSDLTVSYQYEITKFGLKKVMESWTVPEKLDQQMTLWSEEKKQEFENYQNAYTDHIINELSTLMLEIDMNSPSKDFLNEKEPEKHK